jgi:hypothetical protein
MRPFADLADGSGGLSGALKIHVFSMIWSGFLKLFYDAGDHA